MSETIPLTSQDINQTDVTPEFVVGTRKRIKSTMPGIMSNAFGPLREIAATVLSLLWGSEKLSNDTMNMVQSVIAERSMKNSVISNTPH